MTVDTTADQPGGPSGRSKPRSQRRKRVVRILQIVISLVIVVGIFALVIPKIANYRDVWKTITELTPLELGSMVAATIFNLFTYWWRMMAAMPGLTTAQAAVNNQTSTTIANILPGGGVIAIGVAVEMFHSWGFTASQISLLITLTGIWNSFLKLGLPIISVALLALSGQATTALLIPAVIGLLILIGCVVVFALILRKRELARAIGNALGRAWSRIRRLLRREPVTDWGDRAVRFRHVTIELIARRWVPLTLTTLLSHLALYFVLLLCLRNVGVSQQEVSWIQVLAVFSLGRLVTALPITPGGVGFVELAYIGGLVLAGRSHADVPLPEFRAQVTAAVLMFRALTYGIQIPLGGFTYIIWRLKGSWRKPVPHEAAAAPA